MILTLYFIVIKVGELVTTLKPTWPAGPEVVAHHSDAMLFTFRPGETQRMLKQHIARHFEHDVWISTVFGLPLDGNLSVTQEGAPLVFRVRRDYAPGFTFHPGGSYRTLAMRIHRLLWDLERDIIAIKYELQQSKLFRLYTKCRGVGIRETLQINVVDRRPEDVNTQAMTRSELEDAYGDILQMQGLVTESTPAPQPQPSTEVESLLHALEWPWSLMTKADRDAKNAESVRKRNEWTNEVLQRIKDEPGDSMQRSYRHDRAREVIFEARPDARNWTDAQVAHQVELYVSRQAAYNVAIKTKRELEELRIHAFAQDELMRRMYKRVRDFLSPPASASASASASTPPPPILERRPILRRTHAHVRHLVHNLHPVQHGYSALVPFDVNEILFQLRNLDFVRPGPKGERWQRWRWTEYTREGVEPRVYESEFYISDDDAFGKVAWSLNCDFQYTYTDTTTCCTSFPRDPPSMQDPVSSVRFFVHDVHADMVATRAERSRDAVLESVRRVCAAAERTAARTQFIAFRLAQPGPTAEEQASSAYQEEYRRVQAFNRGDLQAVRH